MPRYLSQHTLACLTRQGAETLAQRMQGGGPASAERVLVNMVEGKMFAEFRSDSRESLEAWVQAEGMHYDWVVRIELEALDGQEPAPVRSPALRIDRTSSVRDSRVVTDYRDASSCSRSIIFSS